MKLDPKHTAQETDLLLLDFDGVFYRFTEEFEKHCEDSAARTALKLGVPLSFDEARNHAKQSHEQYGSSSRYFRETYGITATDYHRAYHEELAHHHITESQMTADHLHNCKTQKAVLSHSNRPWLMAMLKKFDLADIFPASHIFGLEDVDYQFKHDSVEPYRHVLNRLGAQPYKSIMVEDTVRNLIPAKAFGMTTVYVTQGRSFEHAQHPQVDYVFDNVVGFLDAFGGTIDTRYNQP